MMNNNSFAHQFFMSLFLVFTFIKKNISNLCLIGSASLILYYLFVVYGFNIMILGAVIAATKILPIEAIEKALEEKLGEKFAKNPKLRELNNKALLRGYGLLEELLKGEKDG